MNCLPVSQRHLENAIKEWECDAATKHAQVAALPISVMSSRKTLHAPKMTANPPSMYEENSFKTLLIRVKATQ